ncbi:hypothetical protein MY8738_002477 [Beauveria namnaoensis]
MGSLGDLNKGQPFRPQGTVFAFAWVATAVGPAIVKLTDLEHQEANPEPLIPPPTPRLNFAEDDTDEE